MKIQRAKAPTMDQVEEARAAVFLDKLRTTLQKGEYKRQDHLIERLLEEGFSSTDIASALIHLLQTSEGARSEASPREQLSEPRDRDRRDERFRERPQRPTGGRERVSTDRGE